MNLTNLVLQLPLNEGLSNEVAAVVGSVQSFKATGDLEWQPGGKLGPAPVFKKGATLDLGDVGDFDKDQAFSYGGWVRISKATGTAGILARIDVDKDNRGWDLYQNDKKFSVHIVS